MLHWNAEIKDEIVKRRETDWIQEWQLQVGEMMHRIDMFVTKSCKTIWQKAIFTYYFFSCSYITLIKIKKVDHRCQRPVLNIGDYTIYIQSEACGLGFNPMPITFFILLDRWVRKHVHKALFLFLHIL